jgi:hypothetical protein
VIRAQLLALVAVPLVVAACTGPSLDFEPTDLADDRIVLRYSRAGFWGSGHYVIYDDGTVVLDRRSLDEWERVGVASIDPVLVTQLRLVLAGTDLDEARRRPPRAERQRCYGGVDTIMTFDPGPAPTFDSAAVVLDLDEPIFAAAWDVVAAAEAAFG